MQTHYARTTFRRATAIMRIALPAFLLSITAFAATMGNGDVVRMVRRNASVPEIVDKINHSESGFNLSSENVAALRKNVVPEIVIRAMFARQTGDTLELPATPVSQAAGVPPAIAPAVAPVASPPNTAPQAGQA